jgi:hypothetical protein
MPSRRRSANKNLGNNLAEVSRRIRYLERRPVRSRLGSKAVTSEAIGAEVITAEQVNFGTVYVGNPGDVKDPKDGLLVVDPNTGQSNLYDGTSESYINLADPNATFVANSAQLTADGKNAVYRQATAPTGGTYAVGDVWFDTSNSNQINRWTGSAWSAFTLGPNAIASINVNQINAGTLNSNVILASNITAGQIVSGVLEGITIQTSNANRRIVITNQDDMIFYNNSNVRMGTITTIDSAWSGGPVTSGGIMIYGGDVAVNQGAENYPSFVASGTNGVGLYATSQTYIEASGNAISTYGDTFLTLADKVELKSLWGETEGGEKWRIILEGPLVLGENADEGPLMQGTGVPTTPGFERNQIVFKYT